MAAHGRGWGICAAAGFAVAAALLMLPSLAPVEAPPVQALGSVAHVGLFAGLAWLAGRGLSPARRGAPLWLGLAAFAGLVELFQPRVGRSADWLDWLYGAAGAAGVCATWHWRGGARWLAIGALGLVPVVWETILVRLEARAFPVVAHPGSIWSRRGWSLNGVELSHAGPEAFELRPAPDAPPGVYPGLFRVPGVRDWRGIRGLSTTLFWPDPAPAIFAVRVDDRPGDPPYADRFQHEFSVTQGWNSVRIPGPMLGRASGGRPLRLDRIRHWGVFLVSAGSFDYFRLGVVRLDAPEEKP